VPETTQAPPTRRGDTPLPHEPAAPRQPLPPPEVTTYRREDFELPLVFAGCPSIPG
jgi:hypothetical protein